MGRVRIIAGELRGRRIEVTDAATLRPTPDRVREALFSILGDDVSGAVVLDAYAGTGALGFEALSRGAARTVFLEAQARAARAIERAAADLGVAGRCRVVRARVLPALLGGRVAGPFDLVLADPPWSSGERGDLLAALAGRDLLAAGATVAIEREARAPVPDAPRGWPLPSSRRWGEAAFDLWQPFGARR